MSKAKNRGWFEDLFFPGVRTKKEDPRERKKVEREKEKLYVTREREREMVKVESKVEGRE